MKSSLRWARTGQLLLSSSWDNEFVPSRGVRCYVYALRMQSKRIRRGDDGGDGGKKKFIITRGFITTLK